MAPCSFMSQAQPYAIKNHRTRPALISTSQTTQKDKIHVSEISIFAMFSTVRVSQFPLDSRRGPFAPWDLSANQNDRSLGLEESCPQ